MSLVFVSGCQKENKPTDPVKKLTDNTSDSSHDKNDENIGENGKNIANNDENDKNNSSNSNNDGKENSDLDNTNKTTSKSNEKLSAVDGAKIGSISFVEDREIWKDFVDEKHIDAAKRAWLGIHVPRILLNSEDAKIANKEIDDLVKSIKDKYNTYKDDISFYDIGIYSSFSVYQDENVLSIMIESYDIWEGEFSKYFVYNFSLPDGKFIDDYELMKNIGVEKDEILGIIENSLKEDQDRLNTISSRDIKDYSYIYNPNNYTGLVLNDLWDNFKSKTRQIFLDEVGTPNFVFAKYDSVDARHCQPILKLKSDKLDKSSISNEYLKMARKLGINPNDEKYKAIIIKLGSCFDEESLNNTLAKLYVWSSIFADYEDPNMLVAMKETEGGSMPYLIGEECYLIIPKYKNASVSLKELEISEDGNLKEIDNFYLDSNSCSGATFICQNISDIAPNGKITIRYRDDILEFSPSISLKDGRLTLPEEVLDGEDILDWKNLMDMNTYSYTMFQIMSSIMHKG